MSYIKKGDRTLTENIKYNTTSIISKFAIGVTETTETEGLSPSETVIDFPIIEISGKPSWISNIDFIPSENDPDDMKHYHMELTGIQVNDGGGIYTPERRTANIKLKYMNSEQLTYILNQDVPRFPVTWTLKNCMLKIARGSLYYYIAIKLFQNDNQQLTGINTANETFTKQYADFKENLNANNITKIPLTLKGPSLSDLNLNIPVKSNDNTETGSYTLPEVPPLGNQTDDTSNYKSLYCYNGSNNNISDYNINSGLITQTAISCPGIEQDSFLFQFDTVENINLTSFYILLNSNAKFKIEYTLLSWVGNVITTGTAKFEPSTNNLIKIVDKNRNPLSSIDFDFDFEIDLIPISNNLSVLFGGKLNISYDQNTKEFKYSTPADINESLIGLLNSGIMRGLIQINSQTPIYTTSDVCKFNTVSLTTDVENKIFNHSFEYLGNERVSF